MVLVIGTLEEKVYLTILHNTFFTILSYKSVMNTLSRTYLSTCFVLTLSFYTGKVDASTKEALLRITTNTTKTVPVQDTLPDTSHLYDFQEEINVDPHSKENERWLDSLFRLKEATFNELMRNDSVRRFRRVFYTGNWREKWEKISAEFLYNGELMSVHKTIYPDEHTSGEITYDFQKKPMWDDIDILSKHMNATQEDLDKIMFLAKNFTYLGEVHFTGGGDDKKKDNVNNSGTHYNERHCIPAF